jgi:hypothetical protein
MMIPRHPINIDAEKRFFLGECPRMQIRVQLARESNHVLSTLSGIARSVYRTGGAVAPDSAEVAEALRLAAQANTGLLIFARLEAPPRHLPLGDGPPVTYTKPVDPSHVDPARWVEAFRQAVITRQTELLTALCGIPTARLKDSPTRGAQGAYDWVDMHRGIWQEPSSFTQHPAFVAVEQSCLDKLKRGQLEKPVKMLTVPYFEVLRSLERRNETDFTKALTEALRQHKGYWGATEKRRNDKEGFVSLPLTSVAALAYDRGLRFHVESDYTPVSWVTGKLFDPRHADTTTT